MALKELISTIARALVDDPDSVQVTEIEGDHNSLIELKVAKGDVGKVIGKSGRVVSAIRCVVSAVAAKSREKAYVKIVTD